jgi:hypothetical protein
MNGGGVRSGIDLQINVFQCQVGEVRFVFPADYSLLLQIKWSFSRSTYD